MTAFRFHHSADVRFRDLDPMGHAHHALPLFLFEEARARYWREVAGRSDVAAIDYIMKAVEVTYHDRIEYPATLRIGVRVAELGTTSFTMEYEVRQDDALLASGRTVQVMYDYRAGEPVAIDDGTRSRITAFEEDAGAVRG